MNSKKKGADEPLSPSGRERVSRVVEQMISIPPSHTDPNGSYTGKPVNRDEVPVQDADDL